MVVGTRTPIEVKKGGERMKEQKKCIWKKTRKMLM